VRGAGFVDCGSGMKSRGDNGKLSKIVAGKGGRLNSGFWTIGPMARENRKDRGD